MNESDKETRKINSKFIGWLKNEISVWTSQGIITKEQGSQIEDIYPAESDETNSSRMISIFATLGSILLGLGVILFFASNWKYVPVWGKLSLIFTLIIVSYGIGYYLAYEKKNFPRVGNALIFLGVMFFGGGIWLVAQIFNLKADHPFSQLAWAIAGFLIVYATRQRPILALSSILLIIWTGIEQLKFQNYNFLYLVILFAIAVPFTIMLKSRLSVFINQIGLTLWCLFSMVPIFEYVDERKIPSAIFSTIILVSILLIVITPLFEEKIKPLSYTITDTSIVLSLIFGFIFTFRGFIDFSCFVNRGYYYPNANADSSALLIIPLILTTLAIVSALYSIILKKIKIAENSINSVLALIFFSFLCLINYVTVDAAFSNTIAVFFNIIYVLLLLALVKKGFAEKEPIYINISLIFFVIFIIARYFDFAWKMMDRSLFFIFGGTALIIASVFIEKWRRNVTKELRGEEI